jgi:hypothetical protein
MNATDPGGGMDGAKVAFIRTSGAVLITPMQLGPTMRMPASRTTASSSCSRRTPSPPTSLNPAEITTSPRTPAAVHSRATVTTCSLGTVITARSTGRPMAPTEGYAGIEWMAAALGFTGKTGPWKSYRSRLSRICQPMVLACRDAPMTAMERGRRMGSRECGMGQS